MPIPKKDESEKDFVDRCIPIVIKEGTAKDGIQGSAICHSIYREWKKKKEGKAMGFDFEKRFWPITEFRMEGEGKERKLTGYAAVFNVVADLGFFKETIEPGAFADAISKSDTRALWDHKTIYVLGRKSAKTLNIREDDHGLQVEIMPPDTQWARDLEVSIERKDVREMSFGFRIKSREAGDEVDGDEWKPDGDLRNPPIRTIKKNGIRELVDVSPVTFPAYAETEIALRSMEIWETANRSIDDKGTDDHLINLGLLKAKDEDEMLRIIRKIRR